MHPLIATEIVNSVIDRRIPSAARERTPRRSSLRTALRARLSARRAAAAPAPPRRIHSAPRVRTSAGR